MKSSAKFTVLNRQNDIAKVKETTFDLIVIGGGITGAGIALDAASRGMKTALFEKDDFASGTSSKSTKLIHGGLRYLKQFDFWLVKEVGSERAIVHKIAPHLVKPEKMLLPLIEGGSYGKWLTSVGLKVYDILASVEGDDQRKMLDKKRARQLEPLLPKKILKGAGYYAEYRTDDARLTIENIKTAVGQGATALNYSCVTDFLYENDQVKGVQVEDRVTGTQYHAKAHYVVSAAGPWVDKIRERNNSVKGKRLHLTKGVHLVFDHKKLPVKQAVYFDVPDGRMIFAIPRGRFTYVGTTDTNYNDNLDKVEVDLADALYLISAVNHMFPKVFLEIEDIKSSWAGLRPLIHEEGKSASELSRKDEIITSPSGLISIAGGKLTGYRIMAERLVNRVSSKFKSEEEIDFKNCNTESITLTGGPFNDYSEVEQYIARLSEKTTALGLDESISPYLVGTYGRQCEQILSLYSEFDDENPRIRLAKAEYSYSVKHEMVLSPLDFFLRRTAMMYFGIDKISLLAEPVFEMHQQLFQNSANNLNDLRDRLDYEIDRHSNFSIGRI